MPTKPSLTDRDDLDEVLSHPKFARLVAGLVEAVELFPNKRERAYNAYMQEMSRARPNLEG
jgi:hypothetical protein